MFSCSNQSIFMTYVVVGYAANRVPELWLQIPDWTCIRNPEKKRLNVTLQGIKKKAYQAERLIILPRNKTTVINKGLLIPWLVWHSNYDFFSSSSGRQDRLGGDPILADTCQTRWLEVRGDFHSTVLYTLHWSSFNDKVETERIQTLIQTKFLFFLPKLCFWSMGGSWCLMYSERNHKGARRT